MESYSKVIPLNNLLLDVENARHGRVPDQNAALKWLVLNGKILKLAESIATHGYNSADPLLVIPVPESEDLYVVVEGNRRTAALKLLHDPEKCPIDRIRRRFRKLSQESRVTLPSELSCLVYPNLEAASYWIRLRHLGEQDGAGIVSWGAKENEYFARRLGQRGPNAPALKLLEYARGKGLITQEEFANIPVTNVTRLINTPEVRQELGLDKSQNELYRLTNEEYFNRALADVLRELAKGVTVTRLKGKDDRIQFIRNIKEQQGWGSYEACERVPIDSPASEEKSFSVTDNSTNPSAAAAPISKTTLTPKDPLSRKTAIPSRIQVKIVNPKMLSIFRELRRLEVDKFPHAAAVLTRVFLEGCVDLYIEKHNLPKSNLKTLGEKVKRVRQHILATNKENPDVKDDLKGLEVFAEEPNSIGSANTFNAVVHNPKFLISPNELKTAWDRIAPCLKWFEGHI